MRTVLPSKQTVKTRFIECLANNFNTFVQSFKSMNQAQETRIRTQFLFTYIST